MEIILNEIEENLSKLYTLGAITHIQYIKGFLEVQRIRSDFLQLEIDLYNLKAA